jgi:hypothetical protein
MPRKVFTAGEILTAADVNTNLMDQAVMVFDSSAARGSAIPTPSEGMVTYLKDTDLVEKYTTEWVGVAEPPAILQVVSTTVTAATFSESLATGGVSGTVTGLTATITPSSASSKIFVSASVSVSAQDTGGVLLYRDATQIALGDSASNRRRVSSFNGAGGGDNVSTVPVIFTDSPATTSAITYSIRLHNKSDLTRTVHLNRSGNDTDLARFPRAISTITVMEVAG